MIHFCGLCLKTWNSPRLNSIDNHNDIEEVVCFSCESLADNLMGM